MLIYVWWQCEPSKWDPHHPHLSPPHTLLSPSSSCSCTLPWARHHTASLFTARQHWCYVLYSPWWQLTWPDRDCSPLLEVAHTAILPSFPPSLTALWCASGLGKVAWCTRAMRGLDAPWIGWSIVVMRLVWGHGNGGKVAVWGAGATVRVEEHVRDIRNDKHGSLDAATHWMGKR